MTAPAAIVLAAGEGRRMGGPKALLVIDGQPLIVRHVERLREAGCRSIVVVVRSAVVDEVRANLGDARGAGVVAADTLSTAASLTIGLGALEPERDQAIVVSPVDMMPARRSTIDALLTAVAEEGVHVATPRFHGRGGHPVAIRETLLRALREGYRGTLRDLIGAAEAYRRRVDVDDPAVTGDLDTPEDLAVLRPGLVPRFEVRLRLAPE
jgi:CTP:molybdopterin cytidylyltransferase MocA